MKYMEFSFSKRLAHFETGIFAALDQKKQEMEAAGKKIWNLSIGTPDFEPPAHVRKALMEAAAKPENYRYAISDLPELTQAVIDYYRRRFGVELEPEEILAVHGSQEGIGHLGMALCDPGDVVLLPDPGYPIFEAGSFLGGAQVEYYPLLEKNGFLPDFSSIPEETAQKAKYMIVSYPSNPVCAVGTPEMYRELIRFAEKYNIIVIHDNAYSDIIYDGQEGTSFLAYPGAKDVGAEFFSLSKSYNVTGARISFFIGNRKIVGALRHLRSQIDFGVFLPVQYAAIAALNGPREEVEKQRQTYEARRDALCGGLRSIGWNVPDSKGTMFVWAPVPKPFTSSQEFCMKLVEKTGVLCTPGYAFGPLGEGYVRFALVLPVSEIEKIVQAIHESGILSGNI